MKNTYQFSNIFNYLIFLKSNFLHNINKNIFFIILFLVSINPFFQISNAQSEKMVFEGVYIDKPVFIQNEQINSNSKNTIDTSSQKLIRTSNSISTLINFDEQTAPCVFGTQTLPGNTYIQRGLTFSGTWKVLNSCSNFVVSNFSQPNFLAWNTALTSRVESLLFTTPVKDVSFGMASNSGVTLNIKLFNEANEIIENRNTPIFSTLTYISFTTNNISKIEISVGNTGSSVGILDNLNFIAIVFIELLITTTNFRFEH